MSLLQRRVFPPGGFQYTQAQTGWTAPPGATFDEVVVAIIRHRQANPRFGLPTDPEMVANELDMFTCLRLNNDPNYCSPMGEPPKPSGLSPQTSPTWRARAGQKAAAVAGRVAAGVGKVRVGVRVLLDWLGSGGKPVAPALAEARAAVCAKCPHNKQGGLETWFTAPIAEIIRQQLAVKNDMQLTTSQDAVLWTCDVCICKMDLKVWCPLSFIKENPLPPESVAQLPDFCWLKTETL